MNFSKNSSNLVPSTKPVEYVQIRHENLWNKECKSDNIFVSFDWGCVIVWVWREEFEREEN